jgi:DNA replicative helicase MCM subunit Mcm2 (Cdc46/Mcm family)
MACQVGGHYDRAKTVCENIKMSAALLSRFDLTFIIMDNPNEGHDKELSEHVIGLHTRVVGVGAVSRRRRRRRTDHLAPPAAVLVSSASPHPPLSKDPERM